MTVKFITVKGSENVGRSPFYIGVVCGVITGSFPTADAAFDPARNALELALRLDDALRLDLADAVPVIVTDADLTRLRVDNVMARTSSGLRMGLCEGS